MTIGAVDIDCGNTSSLEEWLKSGEASELQRNLEERILQLLFSYHPTDFQFQRMVEQLAWIGADSKGKSLLEKDIAELNSSPDGVVIKCEFFNELRKAASKVGHFVADHKTEILIGVGLCATGIGVAAVTGYTVSVAVAGVVVAGAGSIFISAEDPFSSPIYSGIDTDRLQEVVSRKFIIQGAKMSSAHIGWINGINNTFEESKNSGIYLHSLAGGHAISGIYNCSHTPVIDLLEAGLLNHNGFSPLTARLLKSEWQAFHEANAGRPNAKLLQVCHSQGTIDVRNALEGSSQEIRDRVIVLAIAPGAIVPKRLCFMSYNYASERDFVHKLEPSPPRPITALTIDDVILPTFGESIDNSGELIILPSHLGAKGIDHEFISPTYQPILERVLENYKQQRGEYIPDEKGKFK